MKTLGAVAAGLIAFVIAVKLMSMAARLTWPAYAAAMPARTYSLPMLVARLAGGTLAMAAAGHTTSVVAKGRGNAVFGLYGALLTLSALWHGLIWRAYPVWYHLTCLGLLLAALGVGTRLPQRQKRKNTSARSA